MRFWNKTDEAWELEATCLLRIDPVVKLENSFEGDHMRIVVDPDNIYWIAKLNLYLYSL